MFEEVAQLVACAARIRGLQEMYGVLNDGFIDAEFARRRLEAV